MNRQQLRNKFLAILNRNDCSDDLANDFISMAQTRIERTLRIPAMETMSVITGNQPDTPTTGIIIPNDFLSMKYLYCGDTLMEHKDLGHFLRIPDGCGLHPRYYSRVGSTFLVKPSIPQDDTVVMVYYAAQPQLQSDTDANIFTTIASDLLIYAALSYACDYFVDDRTQGFEGRFGSITDDLNEQARMTDMDQSAQQVEPAYSDY